MSNCRSCDAKIEWIKTKEGKNMPVDPEELNYDECKEGDKLVTFDGGVITVSKSQNLPNVKGRIAHFSTCPDANQWRKAK